MSEPRDAAVELVIEARMRPVGNLNVARMLPVAQKRAVGPFVFLDHMGPVELAPGTGLDVPPHPHIGLSTVTYLFAGEIMHRDSLGSVQLIKPGELNLMTAGKGVVHSERSQPTWRAKGGTVHGAQLWLGLLQANELDAPSFAHHGEASLPVLSLPGAKVRVVMGTALGAASPAIHPTRPRLLDIELQAGASLDLAQLLAPEHVLEQHALSCIEGEALIGAQECFSNQLLVLKQIAGVQVHAKRASRLLILGGPPLDGARFIDWNFVSSSKERIEEAKAAWRAQTFPRVPGETEFVPLSP